MLRPRERVIHMGAIEGLAVGVFLFVALIVCFTVMAVDIWQRCVGGKR